MCTILEAMMREGASHIEVIAEIDICEDTFYRWKKENEEFSESVERGKLLSQAWWLCPKNHSYKSVIYSRTSKNRRGCPYCAGQKTLNYDLWK